MAALRLTDYLEGMRAAGTAGELEAAIQVPFEHAYHGRTWSQICKVRAEAGRRIVEASPLAFHIPRLGPRHALTCCGETYRVGYGQNSTGVRYSWHAAGVWAQQRLRENGFGIRAAYRMWEGGWHDYPHRSIALAAAVLAGKVPDPELNVLIRHERIGHGRPINYSVERNNADRYDRRASRPCECGGMLFDWGGGHSEGFEFISWHCNACPDVFTEYMTCERFYALRFCSRECKAVVERSRPKADARPCACCGVVFTPSRKRGEARFCSKSCIWAAMKGADFNARVSRETAQQRADAMRGTGTKGYIKRGGRHEHRRVAEEKLGRPLLPGEVVHHIDGDKHNNDPSNLAVMTQGEHMREHGLGIPGVVPLRYRSKDDGNHL